MPSPSWQPLQPFPSLRARWAVAACSALITAAVLALFALDRPWRTAPPGAEPQTRMVLLTLNPPIRAPAAVPPQARVTPADPLQRTPSPSAKPERPARPAESAAITPTPSEGARIADPGRPTPEVAVPTPRQAVTAAPSAPAASAPLRLDRSVLREAARASRSEVARMADASGTPLGDGPRGRDERLAAEVASTARPDCLPLSNPGGDLLLTPLLALAGKLSGKCR